MHSATVRIHDDQMHEDCMHAKNSCKIQQECMMHEEQIKQELKHARGLNLTCRIKHAGIDA